MIYQVRCFSCGKIFTKSIIDKWINDCEKNKNRKNILDELKLDRICCRTTLIGQINIAEKLPYTK